MSDANLNLATPRARNRITALAGAAVAATALAVGVGAPTTNAASTGPYTCADDAGKDYTCTAYPMLTTGPLMALVAPFLDRIPAVTANVYPLVTGYALGPYRTGPKPLYDLMNSYGYGVPGTTGNACRDVSQNACRPMAVLSVGWGALGLADASRTMLAKAAGQWASEYPGLALPGTTPLGPVAGGSGLTTVTDYLINNPLRPNGGLAARFAPLLNLLGVDTSIPYGPAGPNADLNSVFFNATDVTWAYNTLADFPVTANPFSIANSLFGAVPPVMRLISEYQQGGVTGKTGIIGNSSGIAVNMDSASSISAYPVPVASAGFAWLDFFETYLAPQFLTMSSGANAETFTTLAAYKPDLPLLYPTQVLPALVNPLLSRFKSPYLLGNPLTDVLEPAMKILVNIGYTDVIAPDKLDTVDPNSFFGATFAEEGFSAYDRTFLPTTNGSTESVANQPVTFGSVKPLTAAERAKVPGDVWNALVTAFKAQAAKPLFGILVPATPATATAAAVASARAQAPIAANTAAELATPVQATTTESAAITDPVLTAETPALATGAGSVAIARQNRSGNVPVRKPADHRNVTAKGSPSEVSAAASGSTERTAASKSATRSATR